MTARIKYISAFHKLHSPHRAFSLVFFLMTYICSAHGQKISAVLADEDSRLPIFAAHVFIDNTSIGTTTDTSGFWSMNTGEVEFGKIVISHINYEGLNITMSPGVTIPDTIFMSESAGQLSNVVFKAKFNRSIRKKRLKLFTEAILGVGKQASQSKIVNTDEIMLYEEDNVLKAIAKTPIEILNQNLGYQILFFLDEFEMSEEDDVMYTGSVRFAPIHAKSGKERTRYENNRTKTHDVSQRRFFQDLIHGRVQEEIFGISSCYLNPSRQFVKIADLPRDSIYISEDKKNRYTINISNYLTVKDKRIKNNKTGEFIGFSPNFSQKVKPKKREIDNTGVSYISSKSNQIIVDEGGRVLNPLDLEEYGFWAGQRLAHLLPTDYSPN